MKWPPWRRHWHDTSEDKTAAAQALEEATNRGHAVERLARDLEDIRRRNNLAPRIAAAFQHTRADGRTM